MFALLCLFQEQDDIHVVPAKWLAVLQGGRGMRWGECDMLLRGNFHCSQHTLHIALVLLLTALDALCVVWLGCWIHLELSWKGLFVLAYWRGCVSSTLPAWQHKLPVSRQGECMRTHACLL